MHYFQTLVTTISQNFHTLYFNFVPGSTLFKTIFYRKTDNFPTCHSKVLNKIYNILIFGNFKHKRNARMGVRNHKAVDF